MSLTLQQLQKMGASQIGSSSGPSSQNTPSKGVSIQQLQSMGAQPGVSNAPSQNQPNQSTASSVGNKILGGAKAVGNFLFPVAKDIYTDYTNPKSQTKTPLQQVGDLVLSVLPFIPGLGEAGEGARGAAAVGEGAEAVADASKGTGVMGKLLSSPVTKAAGVGYGAGVASNLSQGQSPEQAISPNAGTIGGAVTGGAVSGIGSLLGSIGDRISLGVIKPSATDIKDGFSLQTIKDNNLGGSLNATLTKTKSLMSDLTNQLKQKLEGSNSSIDLADVFDKTTKDLTSQNGSLSNFGQNSGISRSLQKLQDEVLTANPTGSLSIPDAQTVKQAAGGMGAWQYGSADPDATAMETVYNKFYNNLKTSIEKNSPSGVKDINSKLSDLIPVMNAVIRRIPIADRSGITLSDMVGLVGSTVNPLASIPTALEMASKSGTVGKLLSKYGSKIAGAAPTAAGSMGRLLSSGLQGKL